MRAIATTGAIVNLDRFESLILTDEPGGPGLRPDRLPSVSADGYRVEAVSGDGRRTLIAATLTRDGINAVWKMIRSGRTGLDLAAIARTAPAETLAAIALPRIEARP